MDWTDRRPRVQFKVGDMVAYSKGFLQSISQYTGDMPRATGKITALTNLGTDMTLADIEWDKPDLPGRVNVKNLRSVKSIAYE